MLLQADCSERFDLKIRQEDGDGNLVPCEAHDAFGWLIQTFSAEKQRNLRGRCESCCDWQDKHHKCPLLQMWQHLQVWLHITAFCCWDE